MAGRVGGVSRVAGAIALWLVGSSALAQGPTVRLDMELLRRAGDILWQAQRCGADEGLQKSYFERTVRLVSESPKTTSQNKIMDTWTEYQAHVMCRNNQDCALPRLAPEPCATFLPKFKAMRINQTDWKPAEGLR